MNTFDEATAGNLEIDRSLESQDTQKDDSESTRPISGGTKSANARDEEL